jgi:hypothetical protein
VSTPDVVDQHVADLARALRGPARTRRSMLREVRDGLRDAAAAHRRCGLDPQQAAVRAVHDFGPVPVVAQAFQTELVARQGRWTALLLLVAFPGMTLGWDLLWRSGGVAWHASPAQPVSDVVVGLARVQDTAAVLVSMMAVVLLAATFHRAVSARRIAVLVGHTGAVGALLCAGIGVVMNVAVGPGAGDLIATNPFALPAYGVSALVCGLVVRSAVRTLRVACAPVMI